MIRATWSRNYVRRTSEASRSSSWTTLPFRKATATPRSSSSPRVNGCCEGVGVRVRTFVRSVNSSALTAVRGVVATHTAYDLQMRIHCPRAKVVYDLFHVLTEQPARW